ncbi:MAG: sulfatase [Spirochaetes bacterium]|nr:sulfatase [Spirochaetota bacterium]
MPGSKPNILWVSFEDTYPFYPCYGDPTAKLPHVERLAAEGCVYRNGFSTAGVCAPARSAVITGMYPVSIGTHHMRTTHVVDPEHPMPYGAVIPPHVKCFPEYLRAAGYYCTNNEKTDYQFEAPFTAWDECSAGAHWRKRPTPETPFFAVFNPGMTHESGMWPEKTPTLTVNPSRVPVPPTLPDTPEVRLALARMYTNLETADAVLGRLLKELEEDGLLENTVLFHWSDHGPLPRGKRWPYDAGIHVPMIVRWPQGLKAGSRSDRMVSTVDLGPTVLSLCGVDIPNHMQGRAFLGPREAPPRDVIFAARDRHDESFDQVRAVRDKRYKLIRNGYTNQGYLPWVPYLNRHPILQEMRRLDRRGELKGSAALLMAPTRRAEELYDTETDPWETVNLIDDPNHQGAARRLRGALLDWQKEVKDLGDENETDMVRRWVPDLEQPVTSPPVFIPMGDALPGMECGTKERSEWHLAGPAEVQIHTPTQGASIGYRFDDKEGTPWRLYVSPVSLPPGACRLFAKAIRIGYQESPQAKMAFIVGEKST